ncbi:hypothetical protein [Actinoplanes sp. GCM10030250]|uniref:effector-associated constant component EACC1 n=1 Tax=Actinoplanes sp. GCM10030250 TaxID=3273376 RepID=UPI00360EA33B
MALTLTVPDRLELHSLYDWLRHDRDLARTTTVTMSSSGRVPGEQSTLDVIDVVLSNATAIAALAVSIASWRLARRQETEVTLRRGDRELTTDAADAGTVEKVILELSGEPDHPDDEGTPGGKE